MHTDKQGFYICVHPFYLWLNYAYLRRGLNLMTLSVTLQARRNPDSSGKRNTRINLFNCTGIVLDPGETCGVLLVLLAL